MYDRQLFFICIDVGGIDIFLSNVWKGNQIWGIRLSWLIIQKKLV